MNTTDRNSYWAEPLQSALPHEIIRADADGIMHLDAARLADFLDVDTALDSIDTDNFDFDSELEWDPEFDA